MNLQPQCNVAFCNRVQTEAKETCAKHVGLGQVDWLVVPDPDTGDDAYLYDGVGYSIEWKQASDLRGKFDGTLNVEHSIGDTLWFDLDGGGVIVIPRRSLRAVWA